MLRCGSRADRRQFSVPFASCKNRASLSQELIIKKFNSSTLKVIKRIKNSGLTATRLVLGLASSCFNQLCPPA